MRTIYFLLPAYTYSRAINQLKAHEKMQEDYIEQCEADHFIVRTLY